MGRGPTNNKQKLLESAIDLIWQNSYGSVSVDDICKKAGINKGSFYYYFPSKIDLTLAAIDNFFENSQPLFEEAFNPALEPLDRFKKLSEIGYKFQKEKRDKYGKVCGCPVMSLGSEIGLQEKAILEKIEQIMAFHTKYYETAILDMIQLGQINKSVKVKEKAKQVYGYVMGCVMMSRVLNSLDPLRDNLIDGVFSILGVCESEIELV